MAQRSLKSQIVLYGGVDGSFYKMSGALERFGGQIAGVGSTLSWLSIPLIAAGKQLTNLYTDYDKAKLWVKSLDDYSESTMNSIENVARTYGKTTRFTATTTMNAIGEIMQAGLGFNDMLKVLPNTMDLAISGDMELNDAADMLISNLYATNTALDDSKNYVDLMAEAAADSNTDVTKLGEAVQRLGATSRMFEGGNVEMFTWLGTMGQLGYEAGEAGTYLRNTLLALAAPTDKAGKVMEALGASEDEFAEALEDTESAKAAETMRAIGLSMYDAEGNIRPMVDVMTDLNDITSKMTDKRKAEVMSAIFPKRTISAASGMAQLVDYATKLHSELEGADGAAENMANIRNSGMEGTLDSLKSAVQEVELSAGKIFGKDILNAAGQLHDTLIDISEADPATIRLWVSALTTLAVAGPGLLIVGKAISGIGSLMMQAGTPGGAIALTAVALGLLYKVSKDYNEFLREQDIEEHFGNLTVDAQELSNRIAGVNGKFTSGSSIIKGYSDAVQKAGEDYKTTSAEFAAKIIDAAMFGYTLTPGDKANLQTLGSDMYSSISAGIAAARGESESWVRAMFGADDKNVTYFTGLFDNHYDELQTEAGKVNEKLQGYLKIALTDGNITIDEQSIITKLLEEQNKIEAALQSEKNKQSFYNALGKAQMLGASGFTELGTQLKTTMQATNDYWMEDYYTNTGRLMNEGKLTPEDSAKLYAATMKRIRDDNAPLLADYARMAAIQTQAYGSEFGMLGGIVSRMKTGSLNGADLILQGANGMTGYETANRDANGNQIITTTERDNLISMVNEMQTGLPLEQLRGMIDEYKAGGQEVPDYLKTLFNTYIESAALQYGYSMSDELVQNKNYRDASGNLMYFDLPTTGNTAISGALKSLWGRRGSGTTPTYNEYIRSMMQYTGLPAYVAAGNEEDVSLSDNFWKNLPAAANDEEVYLPASVDKDGLAKQAGDAGTAGREALLEGWQTPTLNAYVKIVSAADDNDVSLDSAGVGKKPKFALGGRATTASIFGEEGAEWAIPEAHTQHVAELLASASKASGFTFGELIARTGGMNDNPNYRGSAVSFSPQVVINAGSGDSDAIAGAVKKALSEVYDELEARNRDRERMAFDA